MPMCPNDTPVITISTMASAQMSTTAAPHTSNAVYSGHASSAPISPPPLQSSDALVYERDRKLP